MAHRVDGVEVAAGLDVDLWANRGTAQVDQHDHVVVKLVGNHQVGKAIAIDVPPRPRSVGRGTSPEARKETALWKLPSPLPSSTLTASLTQLSDQVGDAAAVEVGHGRRVARAGKAIAARLNESAVFQLKTNPSIGCDS